MRLGTWFVLGGLGLGWLGACGKASTGDQVGGETHWLRQCGATSECGPDLECLCGVCTSGCDDDAACSDLGAARCSPRSDTAYAQACTDSEPERLCVRAASSEPEESLDTPLQGRRYDQSSNCLRASEVAGFISSSEPLSCDDAITYATDGESCWQFPSTCLPEGFTALELPLIGSSCAVAEPCEDAATCAEGQVSTIDGCLTCDEARAAHEQVVLDFVQAAGLGTCNTDSECVLESWADECWSTCALPIAAASASSLGAELPNVTSGYCADAPEWRATCGGPPDLNCDVGLGGICRGGTCVFSAAGACAERPQETCEADGDCTLARAFPFDAGQECFADATIAVGCIDPDLSCPPVTTPGLDGDGNCFLFGNCLPAGFERAPEAHACATAAGSTCAP